MPRKRSLPTTASVLSSASTDSTLSSSTTDTAFTVSSTVEDWMYWKRDAQCWTKVYVVLKKHFVWLLRSPAAASFASPLIHMAVTGVERATLESFLITGPSGEAMELHLYDAERVWTWFDALADAADWTRMSLSEHPPKERDSVDRAYRGTLVVYNEERKGSRWHRFWRQQSRRFKDAVRKHIESVVDKYEPTPSRATLC